LKGPRSFFLRGRVLLKGSHGTLPNREILGRGYSILCGEGGGKVLYAFPRGEMQKEKMNRGKFVYRKGKKGESTLLFREKKSTTSLFLREKGRRTA